jgi:hypothetical protein
VVPPFSLARKLTCIQGPLKKKVTDSTALTSSCSSPYKTNNHKTAVQRWIY